jgi:hypothetical protein
MEPENMTMEEFKKWLEPTLEEFFKTTKHQECDWKRWIEGGRRSTGVYGLIDFIKMKRYYPE